MTSIRSFSEILMDDAQISDPDRRRFISIIQKESLRLTRLLDEILDISRLESGAVTLMIDSVNLKAAVEDALDSVSGIVMIVNVEVAAALDGANYDVLANADRLRQVFINIISNAVKYNGDPKPRIDIRTGRTGPTVHVDIIDNGGGVTRQEATVVFEKFARGKQSGRNQGAGLGLPIGRAIMRAMQGDLVVVFQDDGSSFFRVTLRMEAKPNPL